MGANLRFGEQMNVRGYDCSIVIKTAYREFDVPYSEETLREAVSLLVEEAAIEGDGGCKSLRKMRGVTGCVVTPLTIGAVPHLLYLAFGSMGVPVFVSETRNVYQYQLNFIVMEDTEPFDLVQNRGKERRLFEACRVTGFELRLMRGEAVKLKLDVCGERPPVVYSYSDILGRESGERFNGDFVTYKINGQAFKNVYGVTLVSKKHGGTRTELLIKRVLNAGSDFPEVIDEFAFTAQLLRDAYEYRHFGMFRITLKRLVLVSDETNVNSADAVIGPLRYYVAGAVSAEVFETNEQVAINSEQWDEG